jgi:hypothetical protein
VQPNRLDEDPFPYADLPVYRLWRESIAAFDPPQRDAQVRGRFRIESTTAVASAGSCFAERVSERLRRDGYRYVVTEPGPLWLKPEQRSRYNYGRYSARYGNVYTSLQLLQLLQRATGALTPIEEFWEAATGASLDPFRPLIEPDGFLSPDELRIDRKKHLAQTLRAFQESDIFIFTLGLTETWRDARDGTAFPICPGNGRGRFFRDRYVFHNLSVDDNVHYLGDFVELARAIQPNIKIVLTVSPVPLIATALDEHVLAATVHSKSVLLVAAREIQRRYDFVDYFAAYELVTAPSMPQPAFEPDGRAVRADAVDHVMRSFYRHYAAGAVPPVTVESSMNDDTEAIRARIAAFDPCDEEVMLAKLKADPLH